MTRIYPKSDEDWMRQALAEARAAQMAGEVPVGAVLVKNGILIATGRNAPVAHHDPSAHAEINALRTGAAAFGNYRLDGCELFVTLEPCAMCVGAMLHARLSRVVYGAADAKTGAAGSVLDLFADSRLNHHTMVRGGVLAGPCAELIQGFFRGRRQAAREAAQPLRDDALRTPDSRFARLPDYPWSPHYLSDLPSLGGWRMHYLDEGPVDSERVCVCLHVAGQWSYVYRYLISALAAPYGVRFLAPDSIGFGKSDKPKRGAVHTLAWHRNVLLEWVERLDLRHVMLVRDSRDFGLASMLAAAMPNRIATVLTVRTTPSPAPPPPATVYSPWRAPFPDRGFEAGLRAFGVSTDEVEDLDPSSAARLTQDVVGYFNA